MSPSSHKLGQLRSQLTEINRELFALIQTRHSLVKSIQVLKTSNNQPYRHYDSAREWELFQSLKTELAQMNKKELLAFSLLMEAHAGAPESYPAWSEGIHLTEAPQAEEQRINPLIIKLLHPESFVTLNFNHSFGFLHSI